MRWNEVDINRRPEDDDNKVLGYDIPDWINDDDYEMATTFGSTVGFNYAQVYRSAEGNIIVDFGKEHVEKFQYVGRLENVLRTKKLTQYNGINYYRPST